ncbi:hypothetical protein CDL15_Pgr003598 [Punica granatum]|uniref:RING-type domain-containing protein n=1 Tax=Punica granatum TaxID=22663 RepID=A0A218XU53_PUNGR|nr:hypothetical protein CDL15_Pgr003598 [Punica granatum]PKI38302.1 hypothetical protein CRG98_041349 [Punica granatum]
MGFPIGYSEIFVPTIFLHTLSILGLIRNLISSLFHFLGLPDLIEPDFVFPEAQNRLPNADTQAPMSAILIRELLPVVKFESLADPPESCAVCLHEFDRGEEIRWLRNCRHVFHTGCLDRWIDCDQKTCPLCRTQFVPDDMREEFCQQLWAASGVGEFHDVS